MTSEIKIGDHIVTPEGFKRLQTIYVRAANWQTELESYAAECCEILGVDPDGSSLARDFAEEIVLQGIPPMHAIERLRAHAEAQS